MPKKFISVALSFLFFSAYAQVSRKILDRQTGSPIAYATIKILNRPDGVIASAKGVFSLDIKHTDSVMFSCVGYQSRILSGTMIDSVIYLEEKINSLSEVTVEKRKFLQTILLGNRNKKIKGAMNWGPSNGGKDEFAQKIELPDTSIFYRIRKIYLPVKKFVCYGSILLRIFDLDTVSGYPGEELFLKSITVSKKNIHNGKLTIDLTDEHFRLLHGKSFFVSVGWTEDAYYNKCITTIQLSKSSNAQTYSRTLYSTSYSWFPFGSLKDLDGVTSDFRTFFSILADEMR